MHTKVLVAYASKHGATAEIAEKIGQVLREAGLAAIAADNTLYQRQIEATDLGIDALVYEWHGLTEEEIAIVEGRDRRATSPGQLGFGEGGGP